MRQGKQHLNPTQIRQWKMTQHMQMLVLELVMLCCQSAEGLWDTARLVYHLLRFVGLADDVAVAYHLTCQRPA